MQEAARRHLNGLRKMPYTALKGELKETDVIYVNRTGPLDFGFDVCMKIAQDEDGVMAKFYTLTNGTHRKIPLPNEDSILHELRKNLDQPKQRKVVVKAHLVRGDGTEYEIVPENSKFSGSYDRSH